MFTVTDKKRDDTHQICDSGDRGDGGDSFMHVCCGSQLFSAIFKLQVREIIEEKCMNFLPMWLPLHFSYFFSVVSM